jgi:hypothetical protein
MESIHLQLLSDNSFSSISWYLVVFFELLYYVDLSAISNKLVFSFGLGFDFW